MRREKAIIIKEEKTNIEKVIALIIFIFLCIYMVYAINNERPIEIERNYVNSSIEKRELDSSLLNYTQSLDIFKNDRTIKSISLFLENNLEKEDRIKISLGNTEGEQSVFLSYQDFDSGWYELPFSYNNIESQQTLSIMADDLEGSVEFLVTNEDILNIGEFQRGNENQKIALEINLTINNFIWDYLYIILVGIYSIVGISFIIFISKKNERIVHNSYIAFLISILLNLICLIVLNPYFLDTSQIAENSLNFYFLTQKYAIMEVLTMSDAGYLPLLQRIIAIFFVKILGLGVVSLYYMQITAILCIIVFFGSFNLHIFRGKLKKELRFVLSLLMFLLFVNPTVSTYFNFIYAGYFLIAELLICDLEELKRYQYILFCILSALICLSKGLYAIMLPIGIIELMLFSRVAGRRKNIYAIVIMIASMLEVTYAFAVGNAAAKWFALDTQWNVFSSKQSVAIGIIFLLAFSIITIVTWNVFKWWRKVDQSKCFRNMNMLILTLLFAGSLVIGTVAFKEIQWKNLFNWGRAWYIPSAIAMILLIGELAGKCKIERKQIFYILSLFVLFCFSLSSLICTRNKLQLSYHCVSWNVYKEYFDEIVVPVFQYDERFGTLDEGQILWYTNKEPRDNYEYGAPYEIKKITINLTERKYVSRLDTNSEIEKQNVIAVYLNYPNSVGNEQFQLKAYDKSGKYITTINQISPLSSKTIGFISNTLIQNVSYFEIFTMGGDKAYVESDAYIITKK